MGDQNLTERCLSFSVFFFNNYIYDLRGSYPSRVSNVVVVVVMVLLDAILLWSNQGRAYCGRTLLTRARPHATIRTWRTPYATNHKTTDMKTVLGTFNRPIPREMAAMRERNAVLAAQVKADVLKRGVYPRPKETTK